jgi:hypothetical protein
VGDFRPGRFAWKLVNARRLEKPVAMAGRLGIYEIPQSLGSWLPAVTSSRTQALLLCCDFSRLSKCTQIARTELFGQPAGAVSRRRTLVQVELVSPKGRPLQALHR